MKDEPQNRPPWLRNLRPRYEVESISTVAVPEEFSPPPGATEPPAEVSPAIRGPSTQQYVLLLALLLWMNVAVLGCLCMLATQRIVP